KRRGIRLRDRARWSKRRYEPTPHRALGDRRWKSTHAQGRSDLEGLREQCRGGSAAALARVCKRRAGLYFPALSRLNLAGARGHPMIGREAITRLIPHQGAMCMLDAVVACDAIRITCHSSRHLDM